MKVDGCYGGMSRMMTFIREVRTSDPDAILLNAGDYYQVRGREGGVEGGVEGYYDFMILCVFYDSFDKLPLNFFSFCLNRKMCNIC